MTVRRAVEQLHGDFVWTPQPGPQSFAMGLDPSIEMFYGGARGGGKTDLLIALAAEQVIRYRDRARCLILRAEYAQTRDLKRRMTEIYPPLGGHWNGFSQEWRFDGGGVITIGHCRTEDDAAKYQGWAVNFLGIDELTHWADPEALRRLYAILRDATGVPTRWIATGNPGGPGHSWVKDEWIDGATPFQPQIIRDDADQPILDKDGKPKLRCYVPARVSDNPALMEHDPSYVINLKRQAKHLAKAWLEGDWDIAPGAYLEDVLLKEKHMLPAFDPPRWWTRGLAVDWGSYYPYSVGWYCVRPEDGAIIRYRELYGWGGKPNVGVRLSAGEVCAQIKRINEDHELGNNFRLGIGDSSMWAEQGAMKGLSVGSAFREHGVPLRMGPVGRSRASTLHLLVDRLRDGRFFVTENCKHWWRTVPVLPPNPKDPEDVDSDTEDHAIDETRYFLWGWESLRRGEKPQKSYTAHVRRRPRAERYDPMMGLRHEITLEHLIGPRS